MTESISINLTSVKYECCGGSSKGGKGLVFTGEGSVTEGNSQVSDTGGVLGAGTDGDRVVIKVALIIEIEAGNKHFLVSSEVGDHEAHIGAAALTLSFTSSSVHFQQLGGAHTVNSSLE